MIFLVQFGINRHLRALWARTLLLVFEKFIRAYLFQIALEIMWLPILTSIQFNNTPLFMTSVLEEVLKNRNVSLLSL